MESLEIIKERLRAADAVQDTEAANQAALAYEEARFSLGAIVQRVRQPYFVQTA